MTIDCFIPYSDASTTAEVAKQFKADGLSGKIYVLYENERPALDTDCEYLPFDGSLKSSNSMRLIAQKASCDYFFIYTKKDALKLGQRCVKRFSRAAASTGAGWIYSDLHQVKKGLSEPHPLIDWQIGSVRDDFDFGSLILVKTDSFRKAVETMDCCYKFAGLYDARLKISESEQMFHLNEFLYTEIEDDTRLSGEKQFDYVNPKNRDVQIEMEKACSEHLKKIGAYLEPSFKSVNFGCESFPVEASVIIPVKNRIKTIEDAIKSVLMQKTDFNFNLIIIDNHSTDGTSDLIRKYAESDSRVIHIIPQRDDLGIGGCWNEGVNDARCGRFAVQLDSDDVYSGNDTLAKVVNAFYEQNCAMVIGSYKITDFDLNEIPPGVIDHKEWTPENGRNNALRINGLGAPRAFFTPVLREIGVPNTSYGEDYALGLMISHDYQIGRIYDVLYNCRRWTDNSDASLSIAKINANNLYKDKLRTLEILSRKKRNGVA